MEQGSPKLGAVLGRSITILGSTGSVGASTLDVIRAARESYGRGAFPLEALTAQKNVAALIQQAREFLPRFVVIGDAGLLPQLRDALEGAGIETAGGAEALLDAAMRPSELVMAAVVGAAGLGPTLAAVNRGAIVALANKECVVAAGDVLRRAVARSHAALVPVDSEHNAVFQLLGYGEASAVEKVTLTASGGPFLSWPVERLARATPSEATSHPNWRMGAKISVDSATLMNKGLELIEAHLLFDIAPEKLDVLVHPQSIVHCLVAYTDGSVLAHMAAPDMRTPIAYALAWPRRIASQSRRLDLAACGTLAFSRPDAERFPCLKLARTCLQRGGAAPTILNAANEVAVEHFLGRNIRFMDIASTVERTLEALARDAMGHAPATLDEVMAIDGTARLIAREACAALAA
ncbi:MAG: 1-deoxy-D-xylulose-5-phosphate reductoisomerase [Alphaproteobacteria bacterium]